MPFPLSGGPPDSGIEPESPVLQVDSLPLTHRGIFQDLFKSHLLLNCPACPAHPPPRPRPAELFHLPSELPQHFSHPSTVILTTCVCVCLVASAFFLFATLWIVAGQVPLSMEFSKQEYWSGLSSLLQRIFLTKGSNPCFLHLLH